MINNVAWWTASLDLSLNQVHDRVDDDALCLLSLLHLPLILTSTVNFSGDLRQHLPQGDHREHSEHVLKAIRRLTIVDFLTNVLHVLVNELCLYLLIEAGLGMFTCKFGLFIGRIINIFLPILFKLFADAFTEDGQFLVGQELRLREKHIVVAVARLCWVFFACSFFKALH